MGVALLLVVISQLTLHSARRVARTAAVRNTMRRLRTVSQRSVAAQEGSTGGGNCAGGGGSGGGGPWQWPDVGIAPQQGSLQPEPSTHLSEKDACGGEELRGGAALADGSLPPAGVAQVLAAVEATQQRMERMEQLLLQQQQQVFPKL